MIRFNENDSDYFSLSCFCRGSDWRTISEKLIACAQIDGPVRSYYRWDGKLNDGEEWRVLLKTTAEKLEELELETRRIHDYDTFQWLVLEAKASVEYLKWVNESMVD